MPHWTPTRRALLRSAAPLLVPLGGGVRSAAAPPAGLPEAKPAELGIDPRRLQFAHDLMEKWTAGPDAPVPGGAILVGRGGKRLATRYFGKQGPEAGAGPIRRDALFYMASLTKPVIYLAGMTLVERGLLDLSDPVARHIPEFTGEGKAKAQVLHLFTHTSGLPDELPSNAELRRGRAPLKQFIAEAIRTKLLFEPGTRFSYASAGTLVATEIIQRLSGLPIRDFLRREVLAPLGLESTALGSRGLDPARIVRATVPEYQKDPASDWNSPYWREFGSPAGGLFSTPEDYAVLCALMLGGGKYQGVRVLSPATVRRMTGNRLEELPDLPEAVRRTQPWGLGWRLNHPGTPDSWGDLLDRNVFGHTGSVGNLVWMDPRTGGFCLIFSNYLRARAPWRLVRLSNAIMASFE